MRYNLVAVCIATPLSKGKEHFSMQVNAGSIAPITAVQFGANRFYELTLKSITGKDSSQAGQIAVALAAGSTSSLISTPAELIMIQQGRNQRALMTEARSYIGRHGLTALYRGFVSHYTLHYGLCLSCLGLRLSVQTITGPLVVRFSVFRSPSPASTCSPLIAMTSVPGTCLC